MFSKRCLRSVERSGGWEEASGRQHISQPGKKTKTNKNNQKTSSIQFTQLLSGCVWHFFPTSECSRRLKFIWLFQRLKFLTLLYSWSEDFRGIVSEGKFTSSFIHEINNVCLRELNLNDHSKQTALLWPEIASLVIGISM